MKLRFKAFHKLVAVSSTIALIGVSGAWVINPNGTGYISIHEIASAWQTTPTAVRERVADVLAHRKPASAFEVEIKREAQWNIPCVKDGAHNPLAVEWFPSTGVFKTGLSWIPVNNEKGTLTWIRTKGFVPDVDGDQINETATIDMHCPEAYHHSRYTIAKPQLVEVTSEELEVNDVAMPNDKAAP